ncbi:MAG: HIT domain-containing protein [Nanoarchaeota archaeon]|nr:HIT domain-containing protein [Nanoarchaeota archaeon]
MDNATNQLSSDEIQKRMQLIKENCIFCKIVNGEIPAKKIHEDSEFLAFLDINPITKGHTILIPKEHYMMMAFVPDEVLGRIQVLAKQLSELLIKSLNANDVALIIANGQAAGQQIQHFAIHLIPRYEGDNFKLNLEGEKRDEEELKEIKDKLLEKLQGAV